MSVPRRWHPTGLCLLLTLSLAACGRVPPYFAPRIGPGTGTLIVASTPAGANIVLDGVPTGRATPDTIRDLAAGAHVVRLLRSGWAVAPDSIAIDLAASAIEHADFTLALLDPPPPQVVLLEAFSNVNCVGCPQMSGMLQTLMSEPGHGTDRVVLIKYAANWPAIADPHYQANTAANSARMAFYQSYLMVGIPTLVVNGALAGASGQPPALATLRTLVDARLAGDPGFAIEVTAAADARGTGVGATATVRAARAVDHANTVLRVALIQDPVTYETAPGNQGETEFHAIMRDLVTDADAPLPLAEDATFTRSVTLARQAAWPVGALRVVAFVQDTQTREVLQAAEAVVTGPAARATAAPHRVPIASTSSRRPPERAVPSPQRSR